MDSFNELFSRFAIRGIVGFFGVHEMDAYMVLEYFSHEPGNGPANPRDHVHDAIASGFLFQSAFDGFDLSADPPDPGLQFFLFSNGVADEGRIAYPPMLVNGATETITITITITITRTRMRTRTRTRRIARTGADVGMFRS